MKRKKKKGKKKEGSDFITLANFIITAPCGFCYAKVMQGEKHKEGCPRTKKGN
jgi:hypothetical protein